jgi:2-succinyl-5-enolpyruvyl-6-hydroxy-3-cyclohexene-1-carboxylate synthase
VVALHGWPDPESSATELIQGDSREVLQALAAHLGARRCSDDLRAARREFAELFGAANSAVWRVTEQALRTTGDALSEASAVRLAVDAAPSGSVLGLGNSLPIRDVDLYCRFSRKGLRVFAQRGANGIDGLVSGAAGVATALSEPTTLIVGDVSLLHDVGGLWAARQVKSPLVILVIDNAGGRIFEQLPVRSWLEAHHGLSDYWLTPHGLELSRAAELYGVRHQTARTASELSTALRTAHETPATTLIVAKVPPHSALEHRRRVLQLVATEIRSLLQSHPPSFV